MDANLRLDMDEYLPLRDVVFNTLRRAILRQSEARTGRTCTNDPEKGS